MNTEHIKTIQITEGGSDHSGGDQEGLRHQKKFEKLKKPLIYFLMAMACTGCLYLIFKPQEETLVTKDAGFNAAIPQATDEKLESDKQKAYEEQLLEQKIGEKRNALTTLSDYWSDNKASDPSNGIPSVLGSSAGSGTIIQADQNALSSYRNAQQTLGSFYKRDDQEVNQLKKEISRLKNEAVQTQGAPKGTGIEDQLELMERSYQMAAKYLPAQGQQIHTEIKQPTHVEQKESNVEFISVKRLKKNVVSALYREPSDSLFLAGLSRNRFTGLYNDPQSGDLQTRNSIRAVIQQTQLVMAEGFVQVRLSEPMIVGKVKLPEGSLLKASCTFQGGRLQMKISSIEYNGSIQHVDINIYDNDGQLGLNAPYTPEQNTISDIAGNMSQSSGTNIVMTQSAGQQIASDLTRGALQGVSDYFQKKVKMPKVTVKAGHEILLIAKNSMNK